MGPPTFDYTNNLVEFAELEEVGTSDVVDASNEDATDKLEPEGRQDLDSAPCEESHDKGMEEDGEKVTHLLEIAITKDFLGIVGVPNQTDEGTGNLSVTHSHNSHRNGDAKNKDTLYLFDDLQLQEVVRTTLNLQNIEINGMDRIPHQRETDNLEEVNGPLPLIGQGQADKGIGHSGQAYHQRKYHKGGHGNETTVGIHQTIVLVLDGTQDWESDTL